eukprot:TRINITY_DN67679_c10_g4_i2.p1 TRINITY_DN67679_c10_g4~~TRINITY_DN67679_c10_g4_i2.p1  ORF type:complete len:201 (+),score=24.68 TRINITY_DN67679_c10_g4_i2:42-605(+)
MRPLFFLLALVVPVYGDGSFNIQFNNHQGSGCGCSGGTSLPPTWQDDFLAALTCPINTNLIDTLPTTNHVFYPPTAAQLEAAAVYVTGNANSPGAVFSGVDNEVANTVGLGRIWKEFPASLPTLAMDQNYLFRAEGFMPNKDDALAYVDGTSAIPPARRIRVTVVFGANKELGCDSHFCVQGIKSAH